MVEPRNMWWFPKRFAACSLGRVIIVRDIEHISIYGSLGVHEMHHCFQGICLGPFQGPAFLIACLFAGVCYGMPYRANFFEIMARMAAGQGMEP